VTGVDNRVTPGIQGERREEGWALCAARISQDAHDPSHAYLGRCLVLCSLSVQAENAQNAPLPPPHPPCTTPMLGPVRRGTVIVETEPERRHSRAQTTLAAGTSLGGGGGRGHSVALTSAGRVGRVPCHGCSFTARKTVAGCLVPSWVYAISRRPCRAWRRGRRSQTSPSPPRGPMRAGTKMRGVGGDGETTKPLADP